MSNSVSTRNLFEIDRKLKYLDIREKLIKKTLGRQTLSNGEPYQILPGIEKERALRALQWDKVFYSNKKEDPNTFDKSKQIFQHQSFVFRSKNDKMLTLNQIQEKRGFEVDYRFQKHYDKFRQNVYPGLINRSSKDNQSILKINTNNEYSQIMIDSTKEYDDNPQLQDHMKFLDKLKNKIKQENNEFNESTNYYALIQNQNKQLLKSQLPSIKKSGSVAQLQSLNLIQQNKEGEIQLNDKSQFVNNTFALFKQDIDAINSYREFKNINNNNSKNVLIESPFKIQSTQPTNKVYQRSQSVSQIFKDGQSYKAKKEAKDHYTKLSKDFAYNQKIKVLQTQAKQILNLVNDDENLINNEDPNIQYQNELDYKIKAPTRLIDPYEYHNKKLNLILRLIPLDGTLLSIVYSNIDKQTLQYFLYRLLLKACPFFTQIMFKQILMDLFTFHKLQNSQIIFIYQILQESCNINLKTDAFPNIVNSKINLQEKYILMIQIQNETDQEIIMMRVIAFSEFQHHIYPQIYMSILLYLIFDETFNRVRIKNKIADIQLDKDINPQHLRELLQIYKQLCVKQLLFPEVVKRHQKLINEIYPKSQLYDFIKKAKIAIEFGNKILQLYSMYNFIDLTVQQQMQTDIQESTKQDKNQHQTVNQYLEKKVLNFKSIKDENKNDKKVLFLIDGSKLGKNHQSQRNLQNSQAPSTLIDISQNLQEFKQQILSENSVSGWKQQQQPLSKPLSLDLRSNNNLLSVKQHIQNPSLHSTNTKDNEFSLMNNHNEYGQFLQSQQFQIAQSTEWNQMLSRGSIPTTQQAQASRATSKRTIFVKESKEPLNTQFQKPLFSQWNDDLNEIPSEYKQMLIRDESKAFSPLRSSNYVHSSHQQKRRINLAQTPISAHSKRSSAHMTSCYSVLDFKIPNANFHQHMISGYSPTTRTNRDSEYKIQEEDIQKIKVQKEMSVKPQLFTPDFDNIKIQRPKK